MAALTKDRNTPARDADLFELPAAAVKLYAGGIAAMNASGFVTPGATATTLKALGRVEETVDNSGGSAGDLKVKVRRGCFRFANSAAADEITLADVGADCFIVDDQTVAKTNGTSTRSVAGKVRDVDSAGVWVEF